MNELLEISKEEKKEKDKPDNAEILEKFSGLKQNLKLMEKPLHEDDKDRIIEILREEIRLINQINKKVLEEKERIIREQRNTIEQLRRRLKRETNHPFL